MDPPGLELTDLDAVRRSGVFTQASVLTVSSYPTRTSAVLRLKHLLETVLNGSSTPSLPDVAPPAPSRDRRRGEIFAPADWTVCRADLLRLLVSAKTGRARLWPRELRRHRKMADYGRDTFRSMRAELSQRGKTFKGAGADEVDSAG